jgi:transcriptional regulator with XRE-family HTH domain
MDLYACTDKVIEEEIGERIKSLRLRKNITQNELAKATALSLNVIKSLESGRGKISTLIAVLRELKSLDQLNNFIPEISISPLQLARMHGKQKERASKKRKL